MRCVLGLDIGTTSTIGILIRPPDETLALASRPVTLRSDHVGWAEEDPEQWWATSARSCASSCARAASRRPTSPQSA